MREIGGEITFRCFLTLDTSIRNAMEHKADVRKEKDLRRTRGCITASLQAKDCAEWTRLPYLFPGLAS